MQPIIYLKYKDKDSQTYYRDLNDTFITFLNLIGVDFKKDSMLDYLDFDPHEVHIFNGIMSDGASQNDFFVIQEIENFEYVS
jgi:hypothetical protein